MRRAFWDLLKSDLEAEPQRFEHLIILIEEIGERLCNLTPNNHKLHSEIMHVLDASYLKDVFENNAFDPTDFCELVRFIMSTIYKYSAPVDNPVVRSWIEKVESQFKEPVLLYKDFVPKFIEDVHKHIDLIELRIANVLVEND